MDGKQILSLALFGVIIAASVIILTDVANAHSGRETISGILFFSDSGLPSSSLKQLSSRQTFVISPEFTKDASALNSMMADAISRFNSVMVFAGKNAITVGRVFDSGKMVSCYSNEGSYLEGKDINADECSRIVTNKEYAVIKISFPSGKEPAVRISGSTIEIIPKIDSDIPSMTHEVLRLLFGSKASEAVNSTNAKSESLIK